MARRFKSSAQRRAVMARLKLVAVQRQGGVVKTGHGNIWVDPREGKVYQSFQGPTFPNKPVKLVKGQKKDEKLEFLSEGNDTAVFKIKGKAKTREFFYFNDEID